MFVFFVHDQLFQKSLLVGIKFTFGHRPGPQNNGIDK